MNSKTPITEIGSSSIQTEAESLGITEATFIAEGGEGENHISVWELVNPADGISFRVAATNGLPVWEENDPEEFAYLLAEAGIIA